MRVSGLVTVVLVVALLAPAGSARAASDGCSDVGPPAADAVPSSDRAGSGPNASDGAIAEVEPNDRPSTATLISTGVPVVGTVSARGDVDIFAVRAAAGDRLIATLARTGERRSRPFRVTLAGPGYAFVPTITSRTLDRAVRVETAATQPGCYYVVVTSLRGVTNGYRLTVENASDRPSPASRASTVKNYRWGTGRLSRPPPPVAP